MILTLALQIYQNSLFGQKYQWVHFDLEDGFITEYQFDSLLDTDECTREEMLEALEGMMAIQLSSLTEQERADVTGASGRVTSDCAS